MANTTDKYTAVVLRQGNNGNFKMGYLPKENYVYPGDMVHLESGACGTVLLVDDYLDYEDLQKIEKDTGEEFVKIVTVFRKSTAEWEE